MLQEFELALKVLELGSKVYYTRLFTIESVVNSVLLSN